MISTADENMISLMPAINLIINLYNGNNTVLKAEALKSQKRAWVYFWGHFPDFECLATYSSVLISPTSLFWYT